MRAARTDRDGAFRRPNLVSGTYALTVTARGYTAMTSQSIDIAARANTTIDLRLARASVV